MHNDGMDDMSRDEHLEAERNGVPAEVVPGRPRIVRDSAAYTSGGEHRPLPDGAVIMTAPPSFGGKVITRSSGSPHIWPRPSTQAADHVPA